MQQVAENLKLTNTKENLTYLTNYTFLPSLPTSCQRKDQILYNILHIGRTRLTHSYLIEHTDPPKCTDCNQLLSVKHILTKYTLYDHI